MRFWKTGGLFGGVLLALALAPTRELGSGHGGRTFTLISEAEAQAVPANGLEEAPDEAHADAPAPISGREEPEGEEAAPIQSGEESASDEPAGRRMEVPADHRPASAEGSATTNPRARTRPENGTPERWRNERNGTGRSRSRQSRREERQHSRAETVQNHGERGNATNASATSGYAAFRVIAERNIFDTTRSGRSGPPKPANPKPAQVETVTLVGTLSYEKGAYAFFDGSSSSYRKALEKGQQIAGYTLGQVAPNQVELLSGTNKVNLAVGAQLRREDGGEWHPVEGTPVAASADHGSATESSGAGSGAESDVVRRLMEKRAAEMK